VAHVTGSRLVRALESMADSREQATSIPSDLIEARGTSPAALAATALSESFRETKTSLSIFRRYLSRAQSSSGEAAFVVDASRINSKACYDEWQVSQGHGNTSLMRLCEAGFTLAKTFPRTPLSGFRER